MAIYRQTAPFVNCNVI